MAPQRERLASVRRSFKKDKNTRHILLSELESKLEETSLSEEQVQQLLNRADKDHDGTLDYDEFVQLTLSPEARSSGVRRVLFSLANSVTAKNQRAEVHSYLDAYNCFPPPLFVVLVTLLEIGVFFYYYWAHPPVANDGILTYCAGCFINHKEGPFLFAPPLRKEVWRFVTYMLLHGGLVHLIGNMVMQLIIGVPLEVVHKPWRIAPIYLTAVISGALLQYTLDPKVYLVGASGGVYALLTAHLANVFINFAEMPYRWVRIAVVGGFMTLDVGFTVYSRLTADECDKVSHAAHIAGAIAGFFAGVVFLRDVNEHKWERVCKWVATGIMAVVLLLLVLFAIIRTPDAHPWWDSTSCQQ